MSIVASENAGLGPRELNISVEQWITDNLPPNTSNSSTSLLSQQQQQSSHQSKIMNVVVPNVACPPAAAKKIRRKPENKPQSQINKCNNEKRRRELENEYIEQLGEFLQINKRDMTACKPDKAAILSEVVKKFRNLSDQRNREFRANKCPPGCSDSCTLHPVQQGEISSTEPPFPEPSVNGHSPEKSAYFEAVQHYIRNVGWALLEINSEGYIECATENVIDVLHYSRQELCGQSIYSYLHAGDHNKISPILDKNTLNFEWCQDEDGPTFPQSHKRTVRIRWLLKSRIEETLEQKQQRENKYKDLLIISAPVKDDSEESSSVLCLITLPEEDQLIDPTMTPFPNQQLTIRVGRDSKILKVDASQMQQSNKVFLDKEVGHIFDDLIHPHDLQRMKCHLKDVLDTQTDVQMTSYRIQIAPEYYVHAKVESKFFPSALTDQPDFVSVVHEIVNEPEAGFSGHLPNTSQSMTSNSSGLGGPLMTSVINGGQLPAMSPQNGLNSLLNNDNNSSLLPPTVQDNFLNPDLYHDLFEMDNSWMDSRPESSTSMASASTTRPSSATAAFSPVNMPMCSSPLTPYSQPSPASITNNNNTTMTNNNLATTMSSASANNGSMVFASGTSNNSNNFQFSFEDKDKLLEQQQSSKKSTNDSNTSEKLRNLLLKNPSHSVPEMSDQERARNPNQILKNLLNSEDDKDNTLTHKFNPSSDRNRMPLQRARSTTSDSKNKNMLLQQLLNSNDNKSDDDDPMMKQSELLKRLQNTTKDDREMNNNAADFDNEALKARLRFQGSLEHRKRASDDSDDSSPKPKFRLTVLQEKNKMLAALLAAPPTNPNNRMMLKEAPAVRQMPDIPNLVRQLNSPPMSAGGQCENETPNTTKKQSSQKARNNSGGKHGSRGDNFTLEQRVSASPMSANLSLNQILQQQGNQAGFDASQFVSSTPDITSAPASSSTAAQPDIDPELSDLLENFIEFDSAPDYDDALHNSFSQLSSNAAALKHQMEIAEINKIQQSLMECEKEDNFSTGSPPAYPLHVALSQQNRIQTFNQPPPGYNTQRGTVAQRLNLPQSSSGSSNIVSNSNSATMAPATNSQQQINKPLTQQQALFQRQQLLQHQKLQEQQKQRLLQQQQNQQFLMTDQSCITNQGTQNFDALLKSSVAPNVTLTLTNRSGSGGEAQLSPNISIMQQQLSPSQQRGNTTPFSPQPNQNFQQAPFNTTGGQRQLSPQQQQLNQQLLSNFQQANNTNSGNNASQLSPRQPPFNQAQNTSTNWNQQNPANNVRLNLQQANPMLNAQLSQQQQQQNAFANQQRQQQQFNAQRQRSLNSPSGANVSRQNSFSSQDSFPEPQSPSTQQQFSNIFNQQQMRLNRQQSIPQATQHLPGGLNNSSMNNSQIVRQRLSTVVTVRSQQQQPNANAGVTANASNPNNPLRRNMTSPLDPLGSGGGSMVDNNASNGNPMMNQSQQQQQQMSGNMMSAASDLDSSMRFLDMPQDFFGGAGR